jgi:cysteine desulfurase/selenocysteine lyase
MNREDFELLKENIIYFDNGATTLKPYVLKKGLIDYYDHYSANAHRGDYDMSLKVDEMYEGTREKVRKLIHARKKEEIIFTSGATDALNKIIFGYFKHNLKENDEVLITLSEHASNVLPWFELQDEMNIKVSYIPLENHEVTLENVKKAITKNTKVISLAHITNVIGDVRPIKEICKLAHELGILVVVDGAQSIAHELVDVVDLDVDFFAFSAHKVYGPTGVGVLYGKEELLNNIRPIIFGGGMNSSFTSDGKRIYHELPTMLEAGTPNIAGVIAFGRVIDYLNQKDKLKIINYERELKKYCVSKLKEIPNITIYNENSESSIVVINMDGVFAQDLAIYLNKYHICVRAGNHCAKILKEEIGVKNTVRISFGMYNTKEEIDVLIEALKNPKLKEEII